MSVAGYRIPVIVGDIPVFGVELVTHQHSLVGSGQSYFPSSRAPAHIFCVKLSKLETNST